MCSALFLILKPKNWIPKTVEIVTNVQKPSNLICLCQILFLLKKVRKNVFIVSNYSNCVFTTSYLTDSYIIFTLKMESESKITIFGLKMMVKSGLKNIFLKFLHAGDYFPPLHKSTQNHQFSSKNNYLPTWRDFKIIFSRPLFTIIFRPKMVFLVTDSILRVNPMFESVK